MQRSAAYVTNKDSSQLICGPSDYVFGLRTVLLYVKKDDIKMRARLQVNTGSLFYPTNNVCYFLSDLIA